MPLEILPAFNAVSAEPSPVKLPAKLLAGLLSTLTPLKVLAAVSEAPPRFDKALDGVPDPVPPWTSGTKPLEMLVAFNPVNPKPSPLNVPMKVLAALLNATTPE